MENTSPSQDNLVPPSILASIGPKSLGNPQTIASLLEQYANAVEALVRDFSLGKITSDGYTEKYFALIKKYSTIFFGNDPDWIPIQLTHGGPMMGHLIMIMKEYVTEPMEETFRHNYISIYLDYLASWVNKALQETDGNPQAYRAYLTPVFERAVAILTGAEQIKLETDRAANRKPRDTRDPEMQARMEAMFERDKSWNGERYKAWKEKQALQG